MSMPLVQTERDRGCFRYELERDINNPLGNINHPCQLLLFPLKKPDVRSG